MPIPSVVDSANTTISVASTSHSINLPATPLAGNLLLMFIANDSGTGACTHSASGWTTEEEGYGTNRSRSLLSRVATGGESSTVTVTTNESVEIEARVLEIQYYYGSGAFEKGTAVSASTTTPDPPSLTASWGAKPNLFIATTVARPNHSGYPTNCADNRYSINHGTAFCLQLATSDQVVGTFDPSNFTVNTSGGSNAQTIVVRGSSPKVVCSPIIG